MGENDRLLDWVLNHIFLVIIAVLLVIMYVFFSLGGGSSSSRSVDWDSIHRQRLNEEKAAVRQLQEQIDKDKDRDWYNRHGGN